jgi:anti-anti-sigma factor
VRLEKRRVDDVTVLTVDGEIDALSLRTLSTEIDALIETGCERLCLDLHLLTYINSAALGHLIRTKRRTVARGGDLVLVRPSAFVSRTLYILGLDEMFDTFESDMEAVEFLHRE